MEQAGGAVMEFDGLQALEAGKAQCLLIVAIGTDIDQPVLVIDGQHDPAMPHTDATEGEFFVCCDDASPWLFLPLDGMVSSGGGQGNQFQY